MKTISFLYEDESSLLELIDRNELNVNNKYTVRIYTAIADKDEAMAIVGKIAYHFSDVVIIGCSTSGIIHKDMQYEDKTLVMFELYDKTSSAIRNFKTCGKSSADTAAELAAFAEESNAKVIHLLTDTRYKDIHSLVAQFNKLCPGIKLVGGVAGDVLPKNLPSYVFSRDGIQDMSALALSGDDLLVRNWVNIGHDVISEKFTLTDAEGGVWKTVNDIPAVEWLSEQLGLAKFKHIDDWHLMAESDEILRFPMVLSGHNGASRFLKYDNEKKSIIHYFERTPAETDFRIAYTNPNSIVKKTYEICNELYEQPTEQLFSYSCLFRRFYMNNCSSWELSPYKGYGLCGVFMMGEIGNINGTNEFLEGSCSLIGTAENEVYITPYREAFRELDNIEDDTKELLNYVLMKQKNLLSNDNKQLLSELLRQQELSKESLYMDANTGLNNYIKYKEDQQTIEFNKLCLIKLENSDALLTWLGHDRYRESLKMLTTLITECIARENYETSMRIYALNDDRIFVAADGSIDEDEFRRVSRSIFKAVQFIPLSGLLDESNEIMINRFVLVLNEKHLLESALNALQASQHMQVPFLICQKSDKANVSIAQEFKIIGVLNRALKGGGVKPYFQGIHDNRTGKIEKYEALMRIIDIDGTVYYPMQFMDIAKKFHLYTLLSRDMLQQVFTLFKGRKEAVSFNFSAYDINSDEMQNIILELLEEVGDASNFVLEILEDEQFRDIDKLNHFIAKIRGYGVKVAIDDFGSGYSNFLEIMEIKPDFIKIDGKIIRTLHLKELSPKILDVILFLGMRFDIQLIAEFVENQEIQNHVVFKNISFSQGYLFSKPQPYEDLEL